MRLFNKAAPRSADEMTSAFGEWIDEGRAMLGEVLEKPAAAKPTLRDTLEDLGDKFAGYQSSATRIARRGARQGSKYARQADGYVHANPWPIVAGGIALGVIATLLMSQRR
jgi:ElaB/YqjD/DUF883 family membrane-anchored ribosome-binding protein